MADSIDPDPDTVTAAELALGLLEGQALRDAEMRRRGDILFSEKVARWERHFALWFERWPEAIPPESAREALMRTIGIKPANDNPRSWKVATFLGTAVAAALVMFLAVRQAPSPVEIPAAEPSRFLAAALTAEDGVTRVPVLIELPGKRLRMPPAIDVPAGRSAQLWLIAGDDRLAPIGILQTSDRGLSAQVSLPNRVAEGAVLAISIEPMGGSPTGRPTGPVVASGALASI